MATTALVSGAAALVRATDPQAAPQQIESRLLGAAVDLEALNPQYAGQLGAGRLNAAGAVNPGPGTPNPGGFEVIGLSDLLALLGTGGDGTPADLDPEGVVGLVAGSWPWYFG